MRDLLLALLHSAVMTAKLYGPGGVRAVVAKNLLLKQQRLAPSSLAGAKPDGGQPAAVRILVDLPHCRTYPKGCHRSPALDAPRVSSSLGSSQVPPAVFFDTAAEEARTEGAG